MSFLAPLFLAGLALIAGPIIFHLIRQSPRNRVLFSSTELLDATEPKTVKSRRIQNPWLLLLRCLVIALLAFAFARPFIPDTPSDLASDAIQRDIVIAIDRSASMQRNGIQEQLTAETNRILASLAPYDRLSIIGFTDTITPIVTPEQWSTWPTDQRQTLAANALAASKPSDLPGKIDLAIESAIAEIETLRESGNTHGLAEILLLSDFAQGTSLSRIPAIEWPGELSLSRIQLSPTSLTPNLGLRWLGWGETESGEPSARIAISSDRPSQSIAASLALYDGETNAPIGTSRQLLLEDKTEHFLNLPVDAAGLTRPLRFQLTGDDTPFDNALYLAPSYTPQLSVALLSDHETTQPEHAPYFIQKALAGLDSPQITLATNPPSLADSQAYLINRPLSSTQASALQNELSNGKTAIALVSNEQLSATLRSLTANDFWQVSTTARSPLLVGDVDFTHPLFAPFADSRFSNFANIRTWSPYQITYPESESTKVIASFDDGSPLLLETKIGSGTLFVWASDWAPSTSQWALSSKFIPFLHRFALLASGGATLPSNAAFNTETIAAYRSLSFVAQPQASGIYKVASLTPPERWVAFQLSPSESDTRPLTNDDWDRLALPEFNSDTRAAQVAKLNAALQRETATQTEQRQHIWQWLLWTVLGLLALESAIAIILNKRKELAAS